MRPDFVFKQVRLALFVDGCFWHCCPKHATKSKNNRLFWRPKFSANKQRDQIVNRTLRKAGWGVVRIWEHELARKFQVRLVRRIQRAVFCSAAGRGGSDPCRNLQLAGGIGFTASGRFADAFGRPLIDALKPALEKADVRGEVGFVRHMFRQFLLSGYTKVEEILSVRGWTLQVHQVLRPMMIPDRFYYDEALSNAYSEAVDSVKMTPYGYYMRDTLSGMFSYLDLVCVDCAIHDQSVANSIAHTRADMQTRAEQDRLAACSRRTGCDKLSP